MSRTGTESRRSAPSRGRFINSGEGPTLQPIDVGHADYLALVDPDTAFWSLVARDRLSDAMSDGPFLQAYRKKAAAFAREMNLLRFGLKPSAVYFNPTERCNLNCSYCYIPEGMRSGGEHMSRERLLEALQRLKDYFQRTLPAGAVPQIIFHGAEPLLAREVVFAGIDAFRRDFRFGIQTNATLLDDAAVKFLGERDVSIGISLDAPRREAADRTRKDWSGQGVHGKVLEAMDRLRGYHAWSVICTMTRENARQLTGMVEFLHQREVPTCLMNIVRCTLPPSREVKPDDRSAARAFLAALERSYELYRETGRKLIVGNFANVLLAILAPTARRLMCDISPCGGGRCFFAVTPSGDMFPCSEFIGLESFRGGNLFRDEVEQVLESRPFQLVTGRNVDVIDPCRRCAIRHFCGSPCPAEAHEMNGAMDRTGAFCEFYEEQIRYAFRLIADGREGAFLWDGWDRGTKTTFEVTATSARRAPR
ncbi:MAG TPA: peptide-modifying radical SAM enzyme CbpB [Anaeromyxobacteraceae bacterium]|nr:peptide-modifying radical SAM enzyme CbpB [Anaeromyxobacteraceae bacterium]